MGSYGSYGFPPGYFILRSEASGSRVLDVYMNKTQDGVAVGLWPEKDLSLVEVRRNPSAENQVFFIDDSGALCSRCNGHAIDVTEGSAEGSLVIRHRKPSSLTAGRQLPIFRMDPLTGEITVSFSSEEDTSGRKYVLTAMPLRQPRSILNDASDFLASAVSSPLSLFGGGTKKATPEEVAHAGLDIQDDEVVLEERGEEAEVDDSTEAGRQVCVIHVRTSEDANLLEQAKLRRRWRALPLRNTDARTGAI